MTDRRWFQLVASTALAVAILLLGLPSVLLLASSAALAMAAVPLLDGATGGRQRPACPGP